MPEPIDIQSSEWAEQVESDAGEYMDNQIHDLVGVRGNAKEMSVEGKAEHADRSA